jgi:hypothetical protein
MAARENHLWDRHLTVTTDFATVLKTRVTAWCKTTFTLLFTNGGFVQYIRMAFTLAIVPAGLKTSICTLVYFILVKKWTESYLQAILQPPSGLKSSKSSGAETEIFLSGCRGQQRLNASPTESVSRSKSRTLLHIGTPE